MIPKILLYHLYFSFILPNHFTIIYIHFIDHNLDAHFVANIHDEWQIEVAEKDADRVGKLGVKAIQQAGLEFDMKCPLDGEYHIGNNWSETH